MKNLKKNELADFLGVSSKEIKINQYDKNVYDVSNGESYLVLTNEEADQEAYNTVYEELWAFNVAFLLNYCQNDLLEADIIKEIQEKFYERANGLIIALIVGSRKTVDGLIKRAIGLDGRGHFLSPYDSIEMELIDNKLFAYRLN